MMVIEEIFKEYERTKREHFISVDQMKADLGKMSDKIVLYGAGSAGIAFLHYLRDVGIQPICFADGNPKRWGDVCEDLPIINYRDIIKTVGDDVLVIVTINTDGVKYCKSFDEALRIGGHAGVHKNLHDAGCKRVIDYTYFRRCRELFYGDRYNLPSCSDVHAMESHQEEICRVYELLGDEKSKEVYEKIVRFRLVDDTISIPTEPQDRQYFEYEFFPKREDEIFVDCGAYNGISLKTFLRENENHIRWYYGIEPDGVNYRMLQKIIHDLPDEIQAKTTLVKRCVYDSEKELQLYALGGPGSFLADIGTQSTKGMCIDKLVSETGATFIKMNIEGSEISALRGATDTIHKYKPRLAIAGYHKTSDLWEVPLLIYNYNKGYQFHLRSYMNNLSFVYYAS